MCPYEAMDRSLLVVYGASLSVMFNRMLTPDYSALIAISGVAREGGRPEP